MQGSMYPNYNKRWPNIMMSKVVQDYLKSAKLPDICYVACNNEVMFPYIESLEACLTGYSTQRYKNKLTIADHDLPNYYMAYRIKSDKRTRPARVLSQTIVYKIGTCIISLINGDIMVYPKGELIVKVGPDNPDNRQAAYILGLVYGQNAI